MRSNQLATTLLSVLRLGAQAQKNSPQMFSDFNSRKIPRMNLRDDPDWKFGVNKEDISPWIERCEAFIEPCIPDGCPIESDNCKFNRGLTNLFNFLDYGSSSKIVPDKKLPTGCDDCVEGVKLTQNISFYGDNFDQVFVNSNGYVTLGEKSEKWIPDEGVTGDLGAKNYTGPPIIALFFTDLDMSTRGNVYYRQMDNNYAVDEIIQMNTFPNRYFSRYNLIITWANMGHYGGECVDRDVTFQLIITTDHVRTYVIFSYGDIEMSSGLWDEQLDACDGYFGLYTQFPQAGCNNGKGSFEVVKHSGSREMINVEDDTNTATVGQYIFEVMEAMKPEGKFVKLEEFQLDSTEIPK